MSAEGTVSYRHCTRIPTLELLAIPQESHPFFNQRIWRGVGTISLLVAALMAWYGIELLERGGSTIFFLIYWGIFGISLFLSLYMALLDYRYIRLQFKLAEREAFHDTLGTESFRSTRKKATNEQNGNSVEKHDQNKN
jgi:hypothetical protein